MRKDDGRDVGEMTGKNIVAFSGGKDSTAMALLMAERGEPFEMLFTPAGDEPAELFEHVNRMVEMTGARLITPDNKPLSFWVEHFNALPNHRQRWCTRLIKIEPCIAYLKQHPGSTLNVGLRADEPPEDRTGLYGPYATYRYPLREAGLDLRGVLDFLRVRNIKVPKRTNCKRCYGQKIAEWYDFWRTDPEGWASAEEDEARTGHTWRSPSRDTWPAALKDMRAEFERGRRPRGLRLPVFQNGLFLDESTGEEEERECRVCRF